MEGSVESSEEEEELDLSRSIIIWTRRETYTRGVTRENLIQVKPDKYLLRGKNTAKNTSGEVKLGGKYLRKVKAGQQYLRRGKNRAKIYLRRGKTGQKIPAMR